MDVSDVPQKDHGAIHDLDGDVIELCDGLGAAVQVDVVFAIANFGGALWLDKVLGIDSVDHFGPGDASLEQLLRVEVDAHQAILAAIGPGQFRSFNGRQTRAQEVGSQVGQLLLGQTLTGQPDLQNGNIRGAVSDQKRGCRAGRHSADGRLGHRCHLGDVAIKVGLGLEERLDHGDAMVGLRLDMLDIVDGLGHVAFHDAGEAVLHVLGRKARIIEDDTNHRNIDGREDINRGLDDGYPAEDQNQNRHYNECIWPVKCNPYNPHMVVSLKPSSPIGRNSPFRWDMILRLVRRIEFQHGYILIFPPKSDLKTSPAAQQRGRYCNISSPFQCA